MLLLSADLDIQRAYDFYADFPKGRGSLFMRHLDMAFGQLRTFPESGPVVHRHYRRLLVPGYPCGIFYTIEPRGIIVLGTLDIRQDPGSITRGLSQS